MSADHLFPATRFIELRKDIRHATPQGALASFRLCTPAQTHRSILEGDAALLDLSLSGCKIQTDLPLTTAHNYEMILYLPTFPRPILIAKAGIRWVADQRFGVKFLELHEDHDTFLHDAVDTLHIAHRPSLSA